MGLNRFRYSRIRNTDENNWNLTEEGGVEVEVGFPVEAVIVSEEQRDEYPWDHDIPQSEHGEVGGVQTVLQQVLNNTKMKQGCII